MSNDFRFCPQCGGKNIQNKNNRHWVCKDCSFDLYNNDAAAVGCIITDKDNKVLFEIRAKEPKKGFLALPGGFVDPDESAEQAVIRECKEEIGVEPVSVKYICSNPNTYEYKNITYKTCDLFFETRLPENFSLKAQESEVTGFEWKKIESEKDIDELPIAFDSTRSTLKQWIKE